jgi:ADP-heptose:LPS heptosyltransferase
VVDRYLGFAAALGVEDRRVDFGLSPRDEERAAAARRLVESGLGPPTPVLLLQVGSLEDVRQWSAERTADVADRLSERGYGAVVLTGPRHVDDGLEVARRIRRAPVGRECGTLDLRGLLALMAVLADRPGSVLVSGDTAPVHIAVAVGLRVVGLYGSQPAWRNGPYGGGADVVQRQDGLDCAPCRERTCRLRDEPRACMERIPVSAVVERVLSSPPG